MIKLEVIASSSAGNCYSVTDGSSTLLLEAGINIRDIQKAFNFKLSDLEGCLITHEHNDHSKAVKDVMRAGINTYMSKGTKEALKLKNHRIKTITAMEQFKIGKWTILPFDVQHDVSEPLGYLIMNEQGEKLLFATDTFYIRYKFKDLSIIAVECNYSEKILDGNILNGDVPVVMKRRLLKSHFSLENVKEFILANNSPTVREIWLLHLSDNNSDEELFKKEIQSISGKPVYVG